MINKPGMDILAQLDVHPAVFVRLDILSKGKIKVLWASKMFILPFRSLGLSPGTFFSFWGPFGVAGTVILFYRPLF